MGPFLHILDTGEQPECALDLKYGLQSETFVPSITSYVAAWTASGTVRTPKNKLEGRTAVACTRVQAS